ncbi:MAG: hypothetical protein BKP49_09720 [Treponema sp. CETP13]|nr:MAG: hypothetical protein BKP49_09720 [Treponema sp. CETP13]
MGKKIGALIIMGIVLAVTPLCAKDLSLNTAVTQALNKSAQILTKTLDIQSAQIAEGGKYSTFYPTVGAGVTTSRSNEGSVDYATYFSELLNPTISTATMTYTDPDTTLTGYVSASFSFNPAMITSLQTTALDLESKKISLEQAKSALALQVKKLYYGVLVQEAAVKVQQDNIDYMNETLENTRTSYANGDIPELKVLQLESQLSSQKVSIEKSQMGVTSQKRTLAFLIGEDDITEPLTLTDSLPTRFDEDITEYTLDKALQNSKELQSTAINKELLEVQSKALWQSSYIPSLSLSASYMPTATDITDFDTYEDPYDAGSISATIALTVSNFLPGSSAKTNIKKLDISKAQLVSGERSIRNNIVLTYNANIEAIKQAKRQIELSDKNISLSQKSFDLTSLSYENGDTTFSDLQSAQLSVSNAKLSLLQSQYAYLSALLDLEDQCSFN